MKNKRVFISLLASFLLVIISISTAFATFYFDVHNDETQALTRLDDIEENYSVSDSSLKADNYYDVYFFAQPLAADTARLINGQVNYTPERETKEYVRTATYSWPSWHPTEENVTPVEYGYWPSSTDNPEIEIQENTQVKDSISHEIVNVGYKHIRVYQSITTEQFEAIGSPATYGRDYNNWPNPWSTDKHLDFSGWTANRAVASEYAIKPRDRTFKDNILFGSEVTKQYEVVYGGGQGDFDYVNAFSSLEVLNQEEIDGTTAEDNIIFLYPIYTSGKDYYAGEEEDNYQTSVYISTEYTNGITENKYLSQTQISSDNNYAYDYFSINNIVISDITTINSIRLRVAPAEKTNGWVGGWFDIPGQNLISFAGIYNIHLYFINQNLSGGNYASNKNIATTDSQNEAGIFVNTFEHSYDPNDKGSSTFYYIIRVERVYEFHLVGGAGGINSFDYNATSVEHLYQTSDSPANMADDSSMFRTIYFASNIYIGDNLNQFSSNGQLVGEARNNVFTIAAAPELRYFQILPYDKTEDEWRRFTNADNSFQTIDDGGLLSYAEEGEEKDYNLERNNTSTVTDQVPEMLKINQPGYYDFFFTICFNKNMGTTSDEFTNYVHYIKVAVRPAQNQAFIKIYQNDLEDTDENGFIVHENVPCLYEARPEIGQRLSDKNLLLLDANGIQYGTFATYLDSLHQQGRELYDHVTKLPVQSDMIVMKNYIFYIDSAA